MLCFSRSRPLPFEDLCHVPSSSFANAAANAALLTCIVLFLGSALTPPRRESSEEGIMPRWRVLWAGGGISRCRCIYFFWGRALRTVWSLCGGFICAAAHRWWWQRSASLVVAARRGGDPEYHECAGGGEAQRLAMRELLSAGEGVLGAVR